LQANRINNGGDMSLGVLFQRWFCKIRTWRKSA